MNDYETLKLHQARVQAGERAWLNEQHRLALQSSVDQPTRGVMKAFTRLWARRGSRRRTIERPLPARCACDALGA